MISCSIWQKHTFLAFLVPIIIDITHDNIAKIMGKGYDIKNFWYQWYLSYGFASVWYGVISTYDIENFWYHSRMVSTISQISRHLCGELVLVGGATGQELHLFRPRRRQQTGDWCPDEQRRTWSSSWTCCSGCCEGRESAGSCSSSSLCNLKLHWVKFNLKLKHHTQAGSGPGVRVLLEQAPSNSRL